MQRTVTAEVDAMLDAATEVELQVAVRRGDGLTVDDALDVRLDDRPVEVVEHTDDLGHRLHTLTAGPGALQVRYRAVVHGRAAPLPVRPLDAAVHRRASRYAESDRLAGLALAELGPGVRESGGQPAAVVRDRVRDWVAQRLAYVPGSSRGTDSALDTVLASAGVCRDFAHLALALLRALDVPARLVAVYAPGLSPMDFHAVVEVLVDDRWTVVDPTGLAPRQSLLRIATGRDAADTAFLTSYGGSLALEHLAVSAVVAGDLPRDEPGAEAVLG